MEKLTAYQYLLKNKLIGDKNRELISLLKDIKLAARQVSKELNSAGLNRILGDASGTNGEGLQVGDGEIDFKRLSNILNLHAPQSTFIPEIWQGHKNGGEGFWTALNKLNNLV